MTFKNTAWKKNHIIFKLADHKCKDAYFLSIFPAVSYPPPMPLLLSQALMLQLIPHRTAYKISA